MAYDKNSSELKQKRINEAFNKISEHYEKEGTANKYLNGVALARWHDINDIVTNADTSHVLMSRTGLRFGNDRKVRFPKQEEKALEIYQKASMDVFDAILDLNNVHSDYFLGKQKAEDLTYQRVNSAQNKQSIQELVDAWDNVQKKGQLVYWDTETHSGLNIYGSNQTDAITEFNYRVVTRGSDGKWDLSRSSNQPGKIYKSIIGSSKDSFDFHNKLIDRYVAGDRNLSNKDMVTLRRLALVGHSKTAYEHNGNGVYNFTSFAGKDDVAGMNVDDIRRGAKRMRDIGAGQESANLVKYGNHTVRGWEREMLSGLSPIFKDGVTAMGHNTAGFDWPTLATFAKSNNVSKGFRDALMEMTGGSIVPKYQYDTLAALRISGIDRNALYSDSEWEALAANDLTSFQQEALAHRSKYGGYDKVYAGLKAHMADTDTFVGAYLALDGDLPGELNLKGKLREYSTPINLKGGRQQLFMSSSGQHIRDFELWGFRQDAFTNEIRTSDGYAISRGENGKTKVQKEIMDQYLFRKEANYTITNIQKFSGAEKFGDFLGGLNHDLNRDGLYSISFEAVVNPGSESYISQSPVTIVGTKDKLQQYVSSMMYHVADKDKNGDWKLAHDTKMRRDLSVLNIDNDKAGIVRFNGAQNAEQDAKHLAYILDNGSLRMKYESAARDAREFNYKKDTGVFAFLDDMRAATTGKGRVRKNTFLRMVKENSENLEKKLQNLQPGDSIKAADMAMTYHGYFGYSFKDLNNGWKPNVFTETISKQLARAAHVQQNRALYEKAMQHARLRAGLSEMPAVMEQGKNSYMSDVTGDKRYLVDAYYKNYVTAVENAAINKNGEKIARNMKNLGVYAYAKNSFEVNLKGYRGIAEDNFVRFSLGGSGMGFADRLFRAQGIDPEARRLSYHDKVAELKRFQEHLFQSGELSAAETRIADEVSSGVSQRIISKDSYEHAAQKLISSFRYERDANPLSGMSKETYRYMLTDQAISNKNLSTDEITSILNDADKTIPEIMVKDTDDVKNHARIITNEVLFGGKSKDEVTGMLREAGYNDKQIKLHSIAYAERLKDTEAFMNDFLSSAISNGVDIGYDTKQKKVWFAHQGKQLMLDNLPKDIFENGMFYTQIGRTKTASPLGFYDVNGRLTYSSLIQKAAMDKRQMSSIIRRGVENGNLLDQLNYISKAMAKNLRESSSVSNLDAQDRKAAMYFNWGDVVQHFNELPLDKFQTGNTAADAILNNMLDETNSARLPTADKVNTSQRLSLQMSREDILLAAAKAAKAPAQVQDIIRDLSFNTKHSGEFVATMDSMLDFGEDLVSTKRGIHNQASRSIHFDRTSAEQMLQDHDVKFGQAISSKTRAFTSSHIDGDVGYDVETTARVNRVAMSTTQINNVVNDYTAKMAGTADAIDDYSLDMLSSIHLHEGAAALDPRVADRVFSYRDSMQRVAFDKIYERNVLIQDIAENLARTSTTSKRSAMPFFDNKVQAAFNIGKKNGKLSFNYGDGVFINGGEAFLSKQGYDGAAESIYAKESGILRLGIFSHDGKHLVSADKINQLIGSIDASKSGAREQALDLLNKNYNLSYYITGVDAGTNIKLAEMGTEKGMARAMMATTGAINHDVKNVLSKVGLGQLTDMAMNVEYIDSLSNGKPFKSTMFGIMAAKMSGQSADKIESEINKVFGSKESFQNALMSERYRPWEHVTKALQHAETEDGSRLIAPDQKIHLISNTFKAEAKHKDPKALFNRVTNALLDKYNNDASKVLDIMGKSVTGLSIHDGRIVSSSDNYAANLGKLNQIVESEGLNSTRKLKTSDGVHNVDVARVDLEMEPNFDRGRIYSDGSAFQRAIKLNHRAAAILNTSRISENRLNRVKGALKDALGDEAGAHIFDKYLSSFQDGDVIANAAVDFIKDNIYTRPGENHAKERARLEGGKMVIPDSLARSLKQDGINSDIAQSIVDVAAERGATHVGKKVIEERYAAQSFASAFRFNKDGGIYSNIDEMQKRMGVINIADIAMSKSGKDAVTFMDSAIGKESLLDLHIKGSDKQVYDMATGAGRYVYMPYTPPKVMQNGEVIASPYQSQLGRIHHMLTSYNERISGTSPLGTMNGEDKDKFFSNLTGAVDKLKEDIRVAGTSKTGYIANIARANIEDSGIFTAYGNQIHANTQSKFFKGLSFEGISLAEQAGKGAKALDFDYSILSQKAMHEFYADKSAQILSDLGIEGNAAASVQEKLYKRLQTGGTLSLNVREPQGYSKSTSVSALYFSNIVKGDEAIVGAIQHESKKGDYDSDKVEAALLKSDATIKANGKTITRQLDKAMFDTLKNTAGVDVQWVDGGKAMNNHIAAEFVNAESNKLWRMKDNILKDGVNSFSSDHLANYTIEGTASGTLVSRMNLTDPNEIGDLRDSYQTLEAQSRSWHRTRDGHDKMTEEQYEQFFNTSSAQEAKAGIDSSAHKRALISEMLDNRSAEERTAGRRALSFHLTDQLNKMEATTDSLKLGAGEMNYNLFGYLKVAQEANGVSADDFSKIMQVHTALGEAFLSPKNETNFAVDQVNKLSGAMQNAYRAMQGRYDKEKAATEFGDVIRDTLYGRADKEMSKLPAMLSDEYSGLGSAPKEVIDDAINAYTHKIIQTGNLRGTNPKMYDIGVTKGLRNPNAELEYDPLSSDMNQEAMQDINKQATRQGLEAPIAESSGARKSMTALEENSYEAGASILSDRKEMRFDAAESGFTSATDVGKAIANMASHMELPKGSVAGGAIAIAGGLMVAGYASNPAAPAPAETQANGAQQEYKDMYSTAGVPSFSDTGMNSLRGGPKQGYVININAQTANGRQQAVDAINSAIGGAVPAASSINVAMNTSYADKVSQFQIDKMVQNLF